MQNKINTRLAHRFIILDFTIRTLEVDIARFEHLKTASLLQRIYEELLVQVRKDLVALKKEMHRENLTFVKEDRFDKEFTSFEFHQGSLSDVLRYANYALRNHTLSEIEQRIKNSPTH